jgi:hypothetical protein
MEEKVGDPTLKECTAFDKSFFCRHCKSAAVLIWNPTRRKVELFKLKAQYFTITKQMPNNRCRYRFGSKSEQQKCSYLKHRHIYYTTKEVEKKVEDINVVSKLRTRESAKREIEEMVNQLQKRIEVSRNEKVLSLKPLQSSLIFSTLMSSLLIMIRLKNI